MQPDSLVQLVGGGNIRTVEEKWMQLIESPGLDANRLSRYSPVLAELRKANQVQQAETLAWAAMETMSDRCDHEQTLGFLAPFLLAIGESEELRKKVAQLYRDVYTDQEGLEALLKEAGIEGGRPVRRALRTLDVCLNLSEGDYLKSRDDASSARVDSIDRESWSFQITGPHGSETTGAVHLADRFAPADPTDFFVLRQFAPDDLAKKLKDNPALVVIELCRQNDNKTDRHELESRLVPDLMSEGDWKKWWTKARTALKRHANVEIDRKSPFTITLHSEGLPLADKLLASLNKLRDPLLILAEVELYRKECKGRDEECDESVLRKCYDHVVGKASSSGFSGWLVTRRIGEAANVENAAEGALKFLASHSDLHELFRGIRHAGLHRVACQTLVETHPDDWVSVMLDLLPEFPFFAFDREYQRLDEAGVTTEQWRAIVDTAQAEPARCFDCLAWLWNGPSATDKIPVPGPVTMLTRILRALEQCRREDRVTKEDAKEIVRRARTVLAARKNERFLQCLDQIEESMGSAIRTQLGRADNLGRAVREDLLRHLRFRFPALESKPEIAPWARKDVLYVTRSSWERKKEEIEHHVNVTMKENAKAIGAAAERGDLSENSEYKFALEERDLLQARLAQMNDEISKARIMDPNGVPTDHIGIGSRAVFHKLSDDTVMEMSFVGPWDSDLDKGWYNYLAPLAQTLMGTKIGETVEFDHADYQGTYKLASLGNSLLEQVQA